MKSDEFLLKDGASLPISRGYKQSARTRSSHRSAVRRTHYDKAARQSVDKSGDAPYN